MREETKKQLQRIMDQAVKANQIAGMNMMVVKDGREELYLQCGYADKAKGKTIERDTLFRLFSMTKPITAAAAMLLFERGVIDLADPVSKYIPGFSVTPESDYVHHESESFQNDPSGQKSNISAA